MLGEERLREAVDDDVERYSGRNSLVAPIIDVTKPKLVEPWCLYTNVGATLM